MPAWLTFLISGLTVAGAGTGLARDGDTIAEGTGLGGMWVGAILIAAATSLPELLTDVNAVLQNNPALAVGDLFGSSMANMLILAVFDLLTKSPRMLTRVALNQVLVGTLAVFLTGVAAAGVIVRSGFAPLGLGWGPVTVGFAYVAGMRLIHRNREEPPFRTPGEAAAARPPRSGLQRAFVRFGIAALAILVAAPYLAASAAELAVQLGIAQGFAGMVLLAVTTSLPEIAVSAAAVRAGSYNLAVGNLFGSNCFNMAVLLPLDIVHGPGSLLAEAEPGLAIGAIFAALLMALAMLDVLNKSERRYWFLEPGPAFMVAVYFVGLYFAYRGVH